MASLREIKERISSVSSTLKTTSAMKMVASAKFHRVQGMSASLQVYEKSLTETLRVLCADTSVKLESPFVGAGKQGGKVIVLALASDTSLCGAFNSQVIKALEQKLARLKADGAESVSIWPVGEKMAATVNKWSWPVCNDFRNISSQLNPQKAALITDRLMEEYLKGNADNVVVVYNHFYSMGRQVPQERQFLPFDITSTTEGVKLPDEDYICEPSKHELFETLLPYVLRSRIYALLLNSSTAEFAARTVAMQTASDNARDLLDELKLSYNKRRQQAITDELADIAQVD